MNVISPTTRFLLALSMLKGIGPALLKKIAATPSFMEQSLEILASCIPQLARALELDGAWQVALEKAEQQIQAAEAYGARIISGTDIEYPYRLTTTKDDPFILYVNGQLAPASVYSVAVIGTREPTDHGVEIAKRVSRHLAENGVSIISGLAQGCDAVAHKTALDVRGHTVAVLAHGLHTVAPSKHKQLAERIVAAGGALVSEYPFGQDARAQHFVKRDRTQAGLADGVVMIQSDLRGGSLHASRSILEYGRWLAVPYPTSRDQAHNEPKVQANVLIADGTQEAKAELLRCSKDALSRILVIRGKEDYRCLLGASASKEGSYLVQTVQNVAKCDEAQDSALEEAMPADRPVSEAKSISNTLHLLSIGEGNESIVMLRICWQPHKTLNVMNVLASIEMFKNNLVSAADSEWATGLAHRVRYLQKRLDEIAELRSTSCATEENSMFLRFSAEDAWQQMKRVADYASHSNLKTWLQQKKHSNFSESQMPFFQMEVEQLPRKSVEEMVTLLRAHVTAVLDNDLPGSISNQYSTIREVNFDDLVYWFNDSLSVPDEHLEVRH